MPASVREGSPTPTDALHNSGKRETRVYKEPGYLRHRCRQIGRLRLNKIRPFHLATVLTELAKDGYSERSVNLYLITVRGVLKAARRYCHLKPPLSFEGLDWQKVDTQSRRLCTAEEVDQLCEVALQGSKNGRQFVDYLRFLQYSRTRFREAMSVRWQDGPWIAATSPSGPRARAGTARHGPWT
jgi:integrase